MPYIPYIPYVPYVAILVHSELAIHGHGYQPWSQPWILSTDRADKEDARRAWQDTSGI